MSDGRFFRLTNWDKHQNFRGKRAHWMKLSLDFFDDPTIVGLPDSQRLAFIGVMVLCGKRGNCVPFDATYIKKRCSLRVTPDLELFMSEGLIEFTQAECGAKTFPRVEERRVEEKERTEEQPPSLPAYVPPDVRTENALRNAKWQSERKLLALVGQIAERTKREAQDVMREVTAYKRKSDDQLVTGRLNPALLSEERLEKSLEDAEAWLASLEKGQVSA